MPAWSRPSAKCLRSRRSWGCKGLPRLSWRGPCVTFSPCLVWWWRKRYKTLPACGKWAKIGVFGRAGRVLYRRWFRMRYKVLPARLGGGGSGIKLSLLAQNAPKRGVSGVPGEFCTGWADGGACRESFVPVEAPWHGARGRCESTVGTKGPAARAVGRMGASVSVVLGITGRCPAISHAIPR